MILEEQTHIEARPAAVFRFFEEMESDYTDWHPDHFTFRWVTDERLQPGAEAYFEERIAVTGQHRDGQPSSTESAGSIPGIHERGEPWRGQSAARSPTFSARNSSQP